MTDYLTLDLESVLNPKARWTPPEKFKYTEAYKNGEKPIPPPPAQRIVSACSVHLKSVGINNWEPVFIDWGPDLDDLNDDTSDLLDEPREFEMCKRLNDFMNNLIGCQGGTLITFNGRGFDIPLLCTRCMVFGLDISGWYDSKDFRYRFSDAGHLDLLDATSEYGAVYRGRPSLALLCKLAGLPGKVGIDGSMVQAEYDKGNYKEIRDYCMSDNMDTAIVALRWMVLRGRISKKEYTLVVNKILEEACRKDENGEPVHAHTCELLEDSRTDYNALFLLNSARK